MQEQIDEVFQENEEEISLQSTAPVTQKSGFLDYYAKFRQLDRVQRGPEPFETVFGNLLQNWMAVEDDVEIPFEQITIRCKYFSFFLKSDFFL